MIIHRIVNSVFASNTYVIEGGNASHNAFVIDVGDVRPLLNLLEERCLVVEGVFLTHTHYDHIYGIKECIECFSDCIVYTSVFGKEALASDKQNFSRYHDDPIRIIGDNIKMLREGDVIELFSGISIEVFETPGHDKSCLTYRVDNNIISGDSYIPGFKIIASFPNSNKTQAEFSKQRIISMSKGANLYPGHGDIFINI